LEKLVFSTKVYKRELMEKKNQLSLSVL